ncbi:MAG TPA: hypothetical protein VE379_05530, partial [Vicinamibacterales bacterium]|nr:hypothetical protein [Vicinamibacterales bacterium]
ISAGMHWLRQLLGSTRSGSATAQWRQDWSAAAAALDAAAAGALRERLAQLVSAPDDDLEIEREMLDGLEQLLRFAADAAAHGLPAVATGHRVVGADRCHFSAPVSMPDDPAQPSGRLLLTNTRAVFVGGSRGITLPWHAVAQPVQNDRDLILVRIDGAALHRFRCNSYEDVLTASFVARRLAGGRRV